MTSLASGRSNTSNTSSPRSAWFVSVPYANPNVGPCSDLQSVQHAAAVERPEPQMVNEHGDNGPGREGRRSRKHLHPAKREMLPRYQRGFGVLEDRLAMPERDDRFIEVVAFRWAPGNADGMVGERQRE